MNIPAPNFYFGKRIKVFSASGNITVGELFGYDYDYDDDGNEFLEFDVERDDGRIISFTEGAIERIEIIASVK